MSQSIQTFVSNLIAIYRPNKKTYSILKFNTTNRWRPFSLDPAVPVTLWKQIIAPASVKICIDMSSVYIDCEADGIYLKYGNEVVTVVKKKRSSPKNFPDSFYGREITVTGLQNEPVPTTSLWRLFPPPPPLVHIQQQVTTTIRKTYLHIPQHVAWLIAEDASKNNQDCPITLNSISPITASVTNCFHVFESQAIIQALNNKSVCPMCRHKNPVITACFTNQP